MTKEKIKKEKTEDPRILKGEEAVKRYDELKSKGLLLYECVVGSQSYGTALPTSDVDKKFIYIETLDNILSDTYSIQLSVTDDYVGYELGRYLELLGKQNPNIIELLHADKQFVEFCHPMFEEIVVANKDAFLSKKVAFSFGSYAKTQIDKAQGTNKKFMNPMDDPRKSLLDFAWVPHGQGSISFEKWLAGNCIPKEWIGLAAIDHMRYTYHAFVDPIYIKLAKEAVRRYKKEYPIKYFLGLYESKSKELKEKYFKQSIEEKYFFDTNYKSCYNGPVDIDGVQPKMSSIPKGAKPAILVHFNIDGFQKYCEDYKEYHEWLTKRNKQRFVENASNEHNYDRKNMMHCHRLLDMCIEILKGEGVNVLRPNREELLGIRLGNSTYQELVDKANIKIKMIDELYKVSELQAECSKSFINDILLNFRKNFYSI